VYLHQLTERVVPGGDDEHHTEGLRHDLRRGRERSYGRRYLAMNSQSLVVPPDHSAEQWPAAYLEAGLAGIDE